MFCVKWENPNLGTPFRKYKKVKLKFPCVKAPGYEDIGCAEIKLHIHNLGTTYEWKASFMLWLLYCLWKRFSVGTELVWTWQGMGKYLIYFLKQNEMCTLPN